MFVLLNDGSCQVGLQVVVPADADCFEVAQTLSTGSCVGIRGALVESPGAGQKWELQAAEIEVYGGAGEDYPLQKKRHGFEFPRQISPLSIGAARPSLWSNVNRLDPRPLFRS